MKKIISILIFLILVGSAAFAGVYFTSPELLPATLRPSCDYSQDFSEWTECDESGVSTRTRPFEGKEYSYCEYKETKNCGDFACEYSSFGEYSACGDGQKTKTRSLTSGPANVCKELTQSSECTVEPSCEYSTWNTSSPCDPATNTHTKTRTLVSGTAGLCTDLSQVSPCETEPCVYSEFTPEPITHIGDGLYRTGTRTLTSGPAETCTDLTQTKQGHIITLNVEKIVGNNRISVAIRDQNNKRIILKDPLSLRVGLTNVYTHLSPVKISISYKDGGDIYLKDIAFDGRSIMATGSGTRAEGAKAGKIFWWATYDYSV